MDSTSLNQTYRLLALCARVERHPRFEEQLACQLRDFTAWDELPAQAELHGIGPLLWYHFQSVEVVIPETTHRALRGLYLRHRALNQIHTQSLLELLTLLDQRDIRPLVLKGLALAWRAYPDPALRPISDIDLLLAKDELLPALEVLRQAGYCVATPRSQLKRLPKELTANSPPRNGISTHIELHHYDPAHRAFNDNAPDNEFRDFREPPQCLVIDGCKVYTASPLDTLLYLMRHLRGHLFDARADRPLPLKWMADILSLVEKQADEIDWYALCQRDPAFLKHLAVLYSLTPLPEQYKNRLPIKTAGKLGGMGQYPGGWPQWPFRTWKNIGFWPYLWRTFSPPSEWWLRLYYGIDSGSIFWHGQVLYRLRLFQLMGWALVRRLPFIRR
jgi:hypothetical protein